MHRLRPSLGLALLLGFWGAPARANPVSPSPADRPVLLTTAAGPELFHLLAGGDTLSFSVTGPRTLDVVVRRRLPSATVTPPPVPLALLGDGERFLTLQVGQPQDAAATARDGGGGVTSGPDLARVEVPEGGLTLTVRSAPGAPDLFVRVDARAD